MTLLLAVSVIDPPAVLGVAELALAWAAIWLGVCAVKVRLAMGALGVDGVLLLATLMMVVVPLLDAWAALAIFALSTAALGAIRLMTFTAGDIALLNADTFTALAATLLLATVAATAVAACAAWALAVVWALVVFTLVVGALGTWAASSCSLVRTAVVLVFVVLVVLPLLEEPLALTVPEMMMAPPVTLMEPL